MRNLDQEKIIRRIVYLYGGLILVYAVFDMVNLDTLGKAVPWSQSITHLINRFFVLTAIALYIAPVNLIIAYGLFRRRFWVRYGVIAVMLTFPIRLLGQILWWGTQGLHLHVDALSIQLFFVILTLLYFSTRSVKALLGEAHPFKLKSWYGLLIVIIIISASYWMILSILPKIIIVWKSDLPFWTRKPSVIRLEKPKNPRILERCRKIELLGISLLVPKEFGLTGLNREEKNSNKWLATLRDTGTDKTGYIGIYQNAFGFDFDDLKEFRKKIGPCTKFDFEKFMWTNNWNPIVSTMRSVATPSREGNIKEIHSDDLKGFLIKWDKKEHFNIECSLYDRDDKQSMKGSIILKKGYWSENDLLAILSSIEFLKPQTPPQAKSLYEKGMDLCRQGNILEAQIEFANAYYLSPENPEYIYMVAKTFCERGTKNYKNIQELLDIVLKINPEHKDAQQLLKEIKLKPGDTAH
jgi:tetratricopeptide (TPR) repeat protein